MVSERSSLVEMPHSTIGIRSSSRAMHGSRNCSRRRRASVSTCSTPHPPTAAARSRLGEAIEDCRDDWVVCTKAGEEFDGTRSHYDFSEDHILRSVEQSLARLRTDRIEVVLVHSDGRDVAEIEGSGAFRALARLRRERVVEAIGFSGKSATDGRSAITRSNVLMCTINATRTAGGAPSCGGRRSGRWRVGEETL